MSVDHSAMSFDDSTTVVFDISPSLILSSTVVISLFQLLFLLYTLK